MSESPGYKSAYAINLIGGGTTTFNSSSFRFEAFSDSIKEEVELVQDDGLRGTRTRDVSRIALGNIKVGGSIKLQPTPLELEAFMPFILGTATSDGTYAVADPLTDMYMMIDKVAEVPTYLLRINKATFEGSPGEKMNLNLDVVGKTMTLGAAGSFPNTVPAIDTTVRNYMFYDAGSGITIGGSTYQYDKFELSIDNMIKPTYMIGQTATDLEPTDRIIKLAIQTKYTSVEKALYAAVRAGTPATASVAFTDGTNVFTITLGSLMAPPNSVVVPGRNMLRMPFEFQSYGVLGTSKEIVVTLPA